MGREVCSASGTSRLDWSGDRKVFLLNRRNNSWLERTELLEVYNAAAEP